ncbi:MAG: Nif3-like dinuclear metal center hexameric protein [Thermodesulfobacteriota bacterium]
MVKAADVTAYLNGLFTPERFTDSALNGLQAEGSATVTGFCLGVDACAALFAEAGRLGLNYVIVHHGLFWGRPLPLVGYWRERFRLLIEHDLSLYAMHLPMDAHPELGHNAVLARALGLSGLSPFGLYKGIAIGCCGDLAAPLPLTAAAEHLDRLFGAPVRLLAFGRPAIRRIAVVSGAGADQSTLEEASGRGVDLLITGETSHQVFHIAQELGISVAFAGHYETERWSLMELAGRLTATFQLPAELVRLPTGM